MKEVHVVDQAGSVGFVSPSDRRGFETNPQAWTNMNAVRMDEGGVEPAWGHEALDLPEVLNQVMPDNAHSLDYMSNADGDKNFYVVGRDAKIDIYYIDPADPSQYVKRTLAPSYIGVYDSGDTWVTAHKDGHMVMTNGVDVPQMILQDDPDSVQAVDLSGFTTDPSLGQDNYLTCKTITAFRGFLVAGNILFGTKGRAPQMIAWSDRTDTGSIPSSWDYANTQTLAGNVVLPADYGDVIALKEIRDELMIYCERGAYRMQWVGGQYVFRIVPAYDVIGALNPRSVCSVKGSHIIVTYTDIVRTDGQYPESIANGTVRKELFEQLAPDNHHKIQVVAYPKRSEVLIICPDKQDDKWCGKVLAWNWTTGVWAVRHGLLMRCLANMPKLISAIDPANIEANSSYDEIWRKQEGITDGTSEPPIDQTLQTVPPYTFAANYHYRWYTGDAESGPPNGWIVHYKDSRTGRYYMIISKTDLDYDDRSADIEKVVAKTAITITIPGLSPGVYTLETIDDKGDYIRAHVTPDGHLDWDPFNSTAVCTFDAGESLQIVETPQGKSYDHYDQIASTYGTQLADEGVLYMFGIGTRPQYYFPSEPQDDLSNTVWQFDSLQYTYPDSPELWLSPYVERRGINLTNDQTVQVVTAVYPKLEGPGKIYVTVGAEDFIGTHPDRIRWDPPVLFDPDKDYRIACRVAGRRHAIKFTAVKTGAEDGNGDINVYSGFRLTGYDIRYAQTGER